PTGPPTEPVPIDGPRMAGQIALFDDTGGLKIAGRMNLRWPFAMNILAIRIDEGEEFRWISVQGRRCRRPRGKRRGNWRTGTHGRQGRAGGHCGCARQNQYRPQHKSCARHLPSYEITVPITTRFRGEVSKSISTTC